jgi:SNF2 family DNA or RNA helicase
MSNMQRKWYRNILLQNYEFLFEQSLQQTRLLNLVMQLRKVCNHPDLFEAREVVSPF